jgi:hypothetical protein
VSAACVEAVAIAVLQGRVLHATNVTAGRGTVIDWRAVRSGDEVLVDGDAFDVANAFVAIVGDEAAAAAVEAEPGYIPPRPTAAEITVYAPGGSGARGVGFRRGNLAVLVQGYTDEDNADAEAFARKLAEIEP